MRDRVFTLQDSAYIIETAAPELQHPGIEVILQDLVPIIRHVDQEIQNLLIDRHGDRRTYLHKP